MFVYTNIHHKQQQLTTTQVKPSGKLIRHTLRKYDTAATAREVNKYVFLGTHLCDVILAVDYDLYMC